MHLNVDMATCNSSLKVDNSAYHGTNIYENIVKIYLKQVFGGSKITFIFILKMDFEVRVGPLNNQIKWYGLSTRSDFLSLMLGKCRNAHNL
jgi:hypothetical protein